MSLSAGTRLGPYEIQSPLGAGGMGEVWKARDTRLNRTVAIKVASEKFSERFEREARAVAALNHPHICTLHDVGPNYLVMEYIDGKPLKGPMPVAEALRLGVQIADALDAAHRKGIVHRDLKPGNILVTKSGVKLLDFGLAKMEPETAVLPEHAETLTQQGVIAGTLQYMSPEQLEGEKADARADIFAFGAVLYEMVTGRRAFEGSSTASVIAKIVGGQSGSLEQVPRGLDHIVSGCLAKDRDERWQSAADIKRDLVWLAGAGLPEASVVKPSHAPWRERIAWMVAAAFLGGALFLAGEHWRAIPDGERVRFAIYPPSGTDFLKPMTATIGAPQFALSPDGRSIVFVAATPGAKPLLWLRSLDEVQARPIAGTENAAYPFWSPESRRIGFFAEGKLKTILAVGGPVQVITEGAFDPRGGAWGSDGAIIFTSGASGVTQVPAAGGPTRPVTKMDSLRQESTHRWPHFLPDGRHFLVQVRGNIPEHRGVYAASPDGTRKLLVRSDWSGAYAPPGYLLYLDGDVLMARSFDAVRLELGGEPIALAERVAGSTNGLAAISVSRTGILAYASAVLESGRLTWYDRSGRMLEYVGAEGQFTDFRLSPDEKRVAISLVDPKVSTPGIWLADLTRGSMSRFTFDSALEASAVWSPDNTRIVFRSLRQGLLGFYVKSAAGGGQAEPLLKESLAPAINVNDWSLDGHTVLYSIQAPASGWDLRLLPVNGEGKSLAYLNSQADEIQGSFSPNGRFVAYTSNETGRFEVYVQTLPLSDRKWQISTNGGHEPRWRRDGREVYYLSEDRKLMAVPVATETGFDAGVPKALFQTGVSARVNPFRTNYVPARDGQRFLVNTQSGETGPTPITVELNWTAGLKK